VENKIAGETIIATLREFFCGKCNHREWPDGMFDALYGSVREGSPPLCECGSERYLEMQFDFGLEAGPFRAEVIKVFLPKEPPEWEISSGGRVTFYPFLVVVQSLDEKKDRTVWLPYWHIVEHRGSHKEPKKKYGQFAPHMDIGLFTDLVDQARESGFLV
jgi:hypothetical protein